MADTVLNSLQVSKYSPKVNNNIAPLKKLRHLRLVRFNLESPRMAESMRLLGLVAEDLNTQKTIKDFPHED
jgi:hypothetical protein